LRKPQCGTAIGKFDCAGLYKAGFLAQLVITLALCPFKLQLPDVAVRNLLLEILSVLQAEKMANETPDNTGMDNKEEGLSGTGLGQGNEKTDTALLHLTETFTLGVHIIRIFLVLGNMLRHPLLALSIQQAVVNLIQLRRVVYDMYTITPRIKHCGLSCSFKTTGIDRIKMYELLAQPFLNVIDISPPTINAWRITPTQYPVRGVEQGLVMPDNYCSHKFKDLLVN